jgi:hypothetical protein
MKNLLYILAFTLVPFPENLEAVTCSDRYAITIQIDPAGEYIKELEKFVRSIRRVKYQPESYWKEMDILWDSLQIRKEELKDQFSKRQLDSIDRLERKYLRIRKKQTKRA